MGFPKFKRKNWFDRSRSGFYRRGISGAAFRRQSRSRQFWNRLGTVIVAGLAACLLGGTVLFIWVMRDLPNPNRLTDRSVSQTTRIFARDAKTVLYELHGDEKRTLVELSGVSQHAKNATIAIEDKTFYQNKGFSFRGFARAVLYAGTRGGGSTITQQLVKNVILSKEKTIVRKLKELILSIEIARRYSKDDILKMYLNDIPYGNMAFGIESAAQTYFGKSARDLAPDEAALLAAIPQAPTFYSPYGTHRDRLEFRQHYILDLMAEQGYLTADEAAAAKEIDTLKKVAPKRTGIKAPHFVFYVKDLLAEKFGEEAVEEGGLKVVTTLDAKKQEFAEQAIADNRALIKKSNASTAALLAVDPKNGDILAMVGSADYFDDSINGQFNALSGQLQPGSSIKPFVYAKGFEMGYTPDTVLYDVSTDFATGGAVYRPADYDRKERGPVTVRTALAGSLNIPAVKMLYLVGIKDFLDYATGQLGYTIGDRANLGLSLTLGGVMVNPVEHINAFGSFAGEGELAASRALLRVEDASGNVLLKADAQPKLRRVMSEETARQISSILSDDAARSFVFGARSTLTLPDRPVAAKTGTTNNYKDAWIVGYTPSLVAGVWAGDQKGERNMDAYGGSKLAGPIWNQFMRKALEGTPVEQFTAPQPVKTGKPVLDGDKSSQFKVRIDKFTGKLATDMTPADMVEERPFGGFHDILFFVKRDDPRGPVPAHPEEDPQFVAWEAGVAAWAEKQGMKATGEQPPTAFDDVHVLENLPTVSFVSPLEGGTFTTRNPLAAVSASAPRGVASVEYQLDGETVGISNSPSQAIALSVPNHFTKGFHVLTAIAYDDARNRASTSINVNLNASAGDLGLTWRDLYPGARLYAATSFPQTVRFNVPDPKSLAKLTLRTVDAAGTSTVLGEMESPALPDLAMTWPSAAPGYYVLTADAVLVGGEQRTSSVSVVVE